MQIKKGHLIIANIVIVLLIAGGVTLGLNRNNWFGEKAPESSQTGGLDIDPGAKDWTGDELPDKTDESGAQVGIKIPGYPTVSLPANKKDVKVALLNPEGNPCYFVFEIVLESGESIYKSKMVPPGKAVTDLTLSRGLAAGEYPAVIKITTASLTDQSPMNGADVKTVLVVK